MSSTNPPLSYYELLGVDSDVSEDDLKATYKRLALKHHPDKQSGSIETSNEDFHAIQTAYETLRCKESKEEYDKQLKKKKDEETIAVWKDVDLEDCEYDEEMAQFKTTCRCGGIFVISETMLEEGYEIFSCHNCSLSIRLLYEVVES